jgi:hypothetical protein
MEGAVKRDRVFSQPCFDRNVLESHMIDSRGPVDSTFGMPAHMQAGNFSSELLRSQRSLSLLGLHKEAWRVLTFLCSKYISSQ